VVLRDLSPRSFSVDAKARNLKLTFGNIKNARFNGPIALRGTVDGPRLAARVLLDGSRLRIPEISAGAELHPTGPPRDVVFVDARARAARAEEQARAVETNAAGPQPAIAAQRPSLALAVQTTPLFVNGKDADVEVATDLKVITDARGRPRISGQVRLTRGWVRILKNRYDVEEALLLFSGEADPNPALQISLAHRFPEAQIFIDLSGTVHAPKLDLRSEPPIYDRSQILSLILTGRVAPFETGGELDRSMAVASAVSQVLLGGIVDWLAPKVGLDVASISLDPQQDETGETRVRARSELGKFITDRLYLGYRHVWGASAEENQNEGLFEYRITARWLLLTVFGDAGVGGLDLFWIYRY
jgi:autotransporter translocation and assembly factor TamB